MQTRKYPRTLEQAFGPHTSRHIYEQQKPLPKEDCIVIVVCFAGAVVLIGMLLAGWLA
jgi:hypothetical protein